MIDMGHCTMPEDFEEEFGHFYDFRRAYANLNVKKRSKINMIGYEDVQKEAEQEFDMAEERKIRKEQRAAEGSKKGKAKDDDDDDFEEVSDDDWDDVDVQDDDDNEELPPLVETLNRVDEQEDTPDSQFEVIDTSKTSTFEKMEASKS